ncbi:unnamed protein product [Nesidiocoris tenuis]|uniref:Exonuclease domain-containing protein n=1 Tax=Nesidiocoris tenuis TaxID=355587 RepID=A0A6H5G701_9HEMI|nr:unnamed protein product [Nesidiocoris tenuis]
MTPPPLRSAPPPRSACLIKPKPVPHLINLRAVDICNMKPSVVYFDLEATGLLKSADIIQIAALENDNCFNVYVSTKKQLTQSAMEVTGMKLNDDKKLVKNGVVLETVEPCAAYVMFNEWLRKIGDKILLVGHGSKSFDIPLLHANLTRYADSKTRNALFSRIVGFADTFLIAKQNRSRFGLSSLSLINICRSLAIPTNSTSLHDALTDARLVREIIKKMNMSSRIHSYTISWTRVFREGIDP